jgi:hypothetical protein
MGGRFAGGAKKTNLYLVGSDDEDIVWREIWASGLLIAYK